MYGKYGERQQKHIDPPDIKHTSPSCRDGTGSSGSRVTGSPGQHFGPGRVGSRVSV